MRVYTTEAKINWWYTVRKAMYPEYSHMTLRQRLTAIKAVNKAVGYAIFS